MTDEFINVENIELQELITIIGSYLFNGNELETVEISVLKTLQELVDLEIEERTKKVLH